MQPSSSDYLTALLVAVVFIAVIVIVIYGIGFSIQGKIEKHAPSSTYLNKFTPTGLILAAIYTSILIIGMAIKQQFPNSELGLFLNTSSGFATGAIALIASYAISDFILQKLGFPSTRKNSDNVA